MSNPYSMMMDKSNDKTDKSCIILVRAFDSELGNVHTTFLDMPVVNIGTARNLFEALKTSLTSNGLDFSRAVAFMSDTTNVTVHEKIDHNAAKIVFSYGPKQPGYAHILVSSFIA